LCGEPGGADIEDNELVVGGDEASLEGGLMVVLWSKWALRILVHGPGELGSLSMMGEGKGVISSMAARAGEVRAELGLRLEVERLWRSAGVSNGEAAE